MSFEILKSESDRRVVDAGYVIPDYDAYLPDPPPQRVILADGTQADVHAQWNGYYLVRFPQNKFSKDETISRFAAKLGLISTTSQLIYDGSPDIELDDGQLLHAIIIDYSEDVAHPWDITRR